MRLYGIVIEKAGIFKETKIGCFIRLTTSILPIKSSRIATTIKTASRQIVQATELFG